MARHLGLDCSHWQGHMNWDVASDMVDFAFIRAGSVDNSSGICYTDHQFDNNKQWAPGTMPCGFYWFMRPNHDPVEQADYFGDLIQTEEWLLPPVADIEVAGGLAPHLVASSLQRFLEELRVRFDMAPLIYTNPNIWKNIVGRPPWGAQYPLWIAHWKMSGEPTVPVPFPDWEFWQWTSSGGSGVMDGGIAGAGEFGAESATIDLNWCEEETLNKYVNGAPDPNGDVWEQIDALWQAQGKVQTDLDEVENWARSLQFEG